MIAVYFFVMLLGLTVGSFLNVVIYRLPMMLEHSNINLLWPKSHCTHCKCKLRYLHNIPLFSFLFLKGRCHFCRGKISVRYPIVEFLTALFAILSIIYFGLTLKALAIFIFANFLLILFFIDLENYILPDQLTLSLLWLGLLFNTTQLFTTATNAIFGAACGYIFLWTVGFLFKKIRGTEGIGYGDYKLLAALGAWMGWQALPFILLLSSLLGVIVAVFLLSIKKIHRQTPLPFGSFLAIAGCVLILSGK